MSDYRDDPLGIKWALERAMDKQALSTPIALTDDEPELPNDGDTA